MYISGDVLLSGRDDEKSRRAGMGWDGIRGVLVCLSVFLSVFLSCWLCGGHALIVLFRYQDIV